MTRDKLRDEIIDTIRLAHARDEGYGATADRILALIQPQPKLEWREGRSTLFINGIETAATVVERPGMSYWVASLTPLGSPLFIGSEAEARAAVEQAVRKALGLEG